MDETLVAMAVDALGINEDEVRAHVQELPEVDGFYVWDPARGGRSMIVNRQGERLVAKGFVPLERHVEAFRSGRRN